MDQWALKAHHMKWPLMLLLEWLVLTYMWLRSKAARKSVLKLTKPVDEQTPSEVDGVGYAATLLL